MLLLCPSFNVWAKKPPKKSSLSFVKKKVKVQVDKSWNQSKQKSKEESKKNIEKKHSYSNASHLSHLAKDKKSISGLVRLLNQEITQIRILIKKTKNKNILGELWLRLAKRYLEKANFVTQQKQLVYEEKLARHKERRGVKPVRPSKKESRSYIKKTVILGEKYVKTFPKGRLLERAYFLLGSSNFELGYKAAGNEYYSRLVKQFPKGKFVAESYFFRAEYYFDIQKWDMASEMYEKALKQAKTQNLRNLSTYKLAWCYFYERKSNKAFATMQSLLKTAKRGDVSYYEEALKDLVLFYTESKGAKQAPQFFERFGGRKAPFYLETLARFYYDKGRYSDSEMILNYLMSKNSISFKAEEYQYNIVWGRIILGAPIHQVALVMKKWLEKYGIESRWFQYHKNKDGFQVARQRQEQVIRNYILEKHLAYTNKKEYSIKSSGKNLELYLPKFYFMYIKGFRDQKEKPNYISMRFFYAEILYDLKFYKKAVKEYLWVSQHPKHPRAAMAGMNALLCSEMTLPSEKALLEQRQGRTQPIPFTPEVLSFIDSGSKFLKTFPGHKSNDQIYFKIAFLYEVFNQFQKAEEWFRHVIDKYPRGKYVFRSMESIISIYNLRKDYKGLQRVTKEFSVIKGVALGKGRKNAFRDIYLQSSFELARSAEESSDYLKSAKQFESIYRNQKGSPLAVSSLFNSAINYGKANQVKKAISMHRILAKEKTKDITLQAKSQSQLAQLYQRIGRYDLAAKAFSQSARMYPRNKKQVVASLHFNAATLCLALNKKKNALYHYKSYLNLSSDPERFQSLFLMAEVSEKRRRFSEAIRFYVRYLEDVSLSADQQAEIYYRISQLYGKQGKTKDVLYWEGRLDAIGETATEDELKVLRSYQAKIRLSRLGSKLKYFHTVRAPSNLKAQQEVGKKKRVLFEGLKQEIAFVVRYGDGGDVLKSLNVLGKANENMARFLLEAPKPKELKGEGLAQYVQAIQKLAAPFQKEALESYRLLVKKAVAGDFYGPEYERALAKTQQESKKVAVYYSFKSKNPRSNLIDWME